MNRLPDNMRPVACIAGPTASGKSDWAIELALQVDGEVVNADSMQVYNELRILTARPSAEDEAKVPHHLFGHISVWDQYSVGRWLTDVQSVILDCLARQKVPVLVGGTGLYFKALVDGLAKIPQVSDATMDEVRQLAKQGVNALRSRAESLDPVAAKRVLGDDPQRLMRIVSVALGTEKRLSEWQQDTHPVIPKGYWAGAKLLPERAELYERIENRYEKMLVNGGLEEAKQISK